MIRVWFLRYMAYALKRQQEGLMAEMAGVQAMLARNEADQRRVTAQLAMAETERRYRVAR